MSKCRRCGQEDGECIAGYEHVFGEQSADSFAGMDIGTKSMNNKQINEQREAFECVFNKLLIVHNGDISYECDDLANEIISFLKEHEWQRGYTNGYNDGVFDGKNTLKVSLRDTVLDVVDKAEGNFYAGTPDSISRGELRKAIKQVFDEPT